MKTLKRNLKKEQSGLSIFGYKKANAIVDSGTIVILLFVFAIVSFLGNWLLVDINADFQADTEMSNFSKELIQTHTTRYPAFFDGLFIFFFVMVWILALVASFMIDSHPIFFIITLLAIIFILWIGAEMGNVFEEFVGDAELASVVAGYPMTNMIMGNMLIVILLIAFSIAMVLFGKSRANQ